MEIAHWKFWAVVSALATIIVCGIVTDYAHNITLAKTAGVVGLGLLVGVAVGGLVWFAGDRANRDQN